jgi:hypothetical protein
MHEVDTKLGGRCLSLRGEGTTSDDYGLGRTVQRLGGVGFLNGFEPNAARPVLALYDQDGSAAARKDVAAEVA